MNRKSKSAQSIVELIAAILILIPVIFILIDLSIITMAAFKNDSICREACRAAATGDPRDAAKLAQSELDKYKDAGIFASFSLAGAPKTSGIELPSSGHGLVSGNVSVKTNANVHAPFIVGFFVPDCVLEAEHSFPYTYNIP